MTTEVSFQKCSADSVSSSNKAVSSSDQEPDKLPKPSISKANASFSRTSKVFRKILPHKNLEKYDFNRLKSNNTLFSHDITDDDEIWLIQCPNEVELSTLKNAKLDFDSPFSKIKCKSKKEKRKYSLRPVNNASDHLYFVLPNSRTKSFKIKMLPAAGSLLLREDVRIGDKIEPNTSPLANCESDSHKSKVNVESFIKF